MKISVWTQRVRKAMQFRHDQFGGLGSFETRKKQEGERGFNSTGVRSSSGNANNPHQQRQQQQGNQHEEQEYEVP